MYRHDASLKLPYQDNLSALIHEPTFKQAAGEAVFSKARVIATLGNRAVHSHRAIPESDALSAVCELFHGEVGGSLPGDHSSAVMLRWGNPVLSASSASVLPFLAPDFVFNSSSSPGIPDSI